MIALHFFAFLFLNLQAFGRTSRFIGLSALIWRAPLHVGICSLPPRNFQPLDVRGVGGTNTLYIALISASPKADWALNPAAALVGALPLLVALVR